MTHATTRISGGEPPAARGKPRPPFLRALGKDDPPESILIDGTVFLRAEIFKHDSIAATALYRSDGGQEVVCKINRAEPLFGLPLSWIGVLLNRREQFFYALLADLPSVPAPCGAVTAGGATLPTAGAHVFVQGAALKKDDRLPAAFFDEIASQLAHMHERGVFLLDLNKRENILVGRDGRPYLIDFQISFRCNPASTLPWMRWLRRELGRCDAYHLMKHRLKHSLPPLPTEQELDAARPLAVRVHRALAQPFTRLRRALLVRLGVRTGRGHAASEHFVETARRDDAK